MMGRIWNAYVVELTKAARSRYTWLLPLALIAAVCLTPLAQPMVRDGAGDYRFIAHITPMAVNVLGLLMLLMYSAGLVSSELGSGAICTSLLRPLYRHEFVAAKLLMAFTYAGAIVVIVGAAAWSITAILGDLTGVSYGGEALYSNLDMARAYFLGMALALFPLFATAAYGIMISTLTRNTGAAVGTAVGLWMLAEVVKHPLRVRPFLFSTWLETPWSVFTGRVDGLDPEWMPGAALLIVISVAWTLLFALVAMRFMSRRNLQA